MFRARPVFIVILVVSIIFTVAWLISHFPNNTPTIIEIFSLLLLLPALILSYTQLSVLQEQTYKSTMPRVDIWPTPTGLSVKNLSKFPAWVWIDIEVRDKNGQKIDCLLPNRFFTKDKAWQMPPESEFLHPFDDKQFSDILTKNETVKLYINYYSTPTSKVEPQPYFSELIYRYDYKDDNDKKQNNTKKWLIDGFGVERSTIINYTKQQEAA